MNIPGFTAEASLFNVSTRYQATTEATFYGGTVQPASPFSDVTYQDLSYLYRPFRWNCLKRVCYLRVVKQWPRIVVQECRWVPGIC